MSIKRKIKMPSMDTGHIQGIAVDAERKYIYASFTTAFLKLDMNGNIIGSVTGLCGHLGCIAYNYDDGRVYGMNFAGVNVKFKVENDLLTILGTE